MAVEEQTWVVCRGVHGTRDIRRRRGLPDRWHLFAKAGGDSVWTRCGVMLVNHDCVDAQTGMPSGDEQICGNCRRLAARAVNPQQRPSSHERHEPLQAGAEPRPWRSGRVRDRLTQDDRLPVDVRLDRGGAVSPPTEPQVDPGPAES